MLMIMIMMLMLMLLQGSSADDWSVIRRSSASRMPPLSPSHYRQQRLSSR